MLVFGGVYHRMSRTCVFFQVAQLERNISKPAGLRPRISSKLCCQTSGGKKLVEGPFFCGEFAKEMVGFGSAFMDDASIFCLVWNRDPTVLNLGLQYGKGFDLT